MVLGAEVGTVLATTKQRTLARMLHAGNASRDANTAHDTGYDTVMHVTLWQRRYL